MFEEIDYILEGENAERFAHLYGHNQCKFLFKPVLYMSSVEMEI